MKKKKIKISEATLQELKTPGMQFIWEHGEMKEIPMNQIVPNDYNYNEMSPEEFNLLSENVDDVNFLDPLLVVPMTNNPKGIPQMFRIIDGEHRYEQQRVDDAETIKCVVADPEIFTEKEQMRQTARMNRIRGHTDKEKFRKFVNRMLTEHSVPVDEIAYELGYVDQSEFDSLVQAARSSLPSQEAKEEFDEVKDAIKTADDLTNLLNRLFTKYGNTITHNFMFLDFDGVESVWIRLKREDFKVIADKIKECHREDATLDSVLVNIFKLLNIKKFVDKYRGKIARGDTESMFDLDGILSDGE